MLELTSTSLADTPPIEVTLGRVLYHPEAVMLGIEPTEDLAPVLLAARSATQQVTGQEGVTTSGPGDWVPHMTLCYSTANQPAKPLIDAIGLTIGHCTVTIDTMTLVVQWGPERQWAWQPMGEVHIGR
ncbi:2'-5' RNA ligase family protein [Spirillospora sp. NPDC029432]|uniref:2'-5' RNA ligase family protein n=1 Tax=Spirillospora sp. NPDC029432 TaxID=3154599 RepID=UPI00345461CC